MGTVYILLARGFEECEALIPADLLKRAGADVVLVATEGGLAVPGSHGMTVTADITLDELRREDTACVVLPGGKAGTEALSENPRVRSLIEYAAARGITVAAICAAPSILGNMGLPRSTPSLHPRLPARTSPAKRSKATIYSSPPRGWGSRLSSGSVLSNRFSAATESRRSKARSDTANNERPRGANKT